MQASKGWRSWAEQGIKLPHPLRGVQAQKAPVLLQVCTAHPQQDLQTSSHPDGCVTQVCSSVIKNMMTVHL